MSSISVDAITDINGGNTTSINGTTPNAYNTVGKNLIINGAMQIAQRGTSASIASGGAYLTCDRWRILNANATQTATISQDTDAPDGFSNSLKWNTTVAGTLSSNGYLGIEQKLEGQMLQQLAFGSTSAKKWTLSFWVKSSVTGTYAISHYSADNSNRVIGSTYTINTANTWEKKTVTYDGDTVANFDNDNNESLRVSFHLAAGSQMKSSDNTSWTAYSASMWAYGQQADLCSNTGTFYLTGVQLEVGESATEFEHRPYTIELQLCQRYYQVFDDEYGSTTCFAGRGDGGSGTAASWTMPLAVCMRTAPTVTSGTVYYFDHNSHTTSTSATTCGGHNPLNPFVSLYNNGFSGTVNNRMCACGPSNPTPITLDSEL